MLVYDVRIVRTETVQCTTSARKFIFFFYFDVHSLDSTFNLLKNRVYSAAEFYFIYIEVLIILLMLIDVNGADNVIFL